MKSTKMVSLAICGIGKQPTDETSVGRCVGFGKCTSCARGQNNSGTINEFFPGEIGVEIAQEKPDGSVNSGMIVLLVAKFDAIWEIGVGYHKFSLAKELVLGFVPHLAINDFGDVRIQIVELGFELGSKVIEIG